ncbi:MAG: 37S ribosomal protein S23 mitochondrial [Alyxoria varia]|nr:MAG: 37S ribosomal protein S23 mitochondrial [Alyxoria varia]
MASRPCCWRCLLRSSSSTSSSPRSSIHPTTTIPSIATWTSRNPSARTSFLHTTAVSRAQTGSSLRLKKKTRVKSTKPPAPGERKAVRKRVVLSNTNAVQVPGLEEWPIKTAAEAADGQDGADVKVSATSLAPVGSIVSLPAETVDGLRALESFKPSQGWGFFRTPSCLIRGITEEVLQGMKRSEEKAGDPESVLRRVIIGARGSGKSVLLLQAQGYALMRGWVVLHVPEAQDLTTATTAYGPLSTNPNDRTSTLYSQKDYTAALLTRILRANRTVLSNLTLSQAHPKFPVPLQSNISLDRLAAYGANDPDIAWPAFEALWTELTVPNKGQSGQQKQPPQPRPPILLTLDSLAHASRLTQYLAPSMHYIHAYDLTLLSHFSSYLSGSSTLEPNPSTDTTANNKSFTLPNGGAILAADSMSNRPKNPALDLAIRMASSNTAATSPSSSSAPLDHDPLNPYTPIDPRVMASLTAPHSSARFMRIPPPSRAETRTLLNYYAGSGMMKAPVTDELVSEMWSICGGGGDQAGGGGAQGGRAEEDGGEESAGYDRPPAFSTSHGLRNTLGRGGGEGTIGELERSCVGGFMGGLM